MKTQFIAPAFIALSLAAAGNLPAADKAPEPPVPVTRIVTEEAPKPPRVQTENQQLYSGVSSPTLVPVEQAQALVNRFKEAYIKMGSPRIVFHVNRDLIDTNSGIKLIGHTERYEETKSEFKSDVEKTGQAPTAPQTQINVAGVGNAGDGAKIPQGKTEATSTNLKTSGENTYAVKESTKLTLNDKQTIRDIERLFGRVFRAGGASLADQKTAADLLDEKSSGKLTGTSDQAGKDREALSKVADVAIEILVSSRSLTLPGISGNQTAIVPDIQATAIRLQDASIIGQASATDILGKDGQAGNLARYFDVRDITEATALALMEDMLGSVK